MKYLIVDGYLGGTGIRDKYKAGYLNPKDLKLSDDIVNQIIIWLSKYKDAHHNGFNDLNIGNELDREGNEIAVKIKKELVHIKIEYFSAMRMTNETI
ncbi:hypothetical protein [Flavobacterium cerinum]|uniref:Uncharacterized protein n=1 Tax=Flavobacterium cerinum TaxID=2502784 RepID=A0A3S3TVC7_9FLAO|nr:hypothetical protein [Flavobacterium cerinum]RWW92066.1 hypothetical protein EPI11_16815 [Flavobacterium cerinum]